MNVALVEMCHGRISPCNSFTPLALLKLSTFYKSKGYNVEYVQTPNLPKATPDIICFSIIFMFNANKDVGFIRAYAKKFPNAKIKIGGVAPFFDSEKYKINENCEIHLGLCSEIETLTPDYKLFNKDFSYGFTSRGCINKCAWCVVPKFEGDIRPIENWETALGDGHKIFYAFDNNFTACSLEHIDKVLYTIKSKDMRVEFNQGMDIVEFVKNKELIKIFKKYNCFYKLIFSWDSKRQDKYIEPAFNLLIENKLSVKEKLSIYMLYGFNDSLEEITNRCKLLSKFKFSFIVKFMRFKNLDTGEYNNSWENDLEKKFANFISSITVNGAPDNSQLYLFENKDVLKILFDLSVTYKTISKGSTRKIALGVLFEKAKQIHLDLQKQNQKDII